MIIRPILTAFCATVAIFASAGESWSEPPGASHPVSRNASKTQPAKLLAVFVVDSNDKELTTPLK
jgi:quercetin dioxygenase-like cupin family protein